MTDLDHSELGLPKALYIHVPFCRSRCGYCAFHSTTHWLPEAQQRYVSQVVHHLEASTPVLRSVGSLYVGGGTPSVLPPNLIERILRAAQRACGFSLEEITVEANPESAGDEFISVLQESGVSRLSVGVQTLARTVSEQIGRTPVDVPALAGIRERWPRDLSLDLLIDAPGALPADSNRAARAAAEIGAEHVSAYLLSAEPGTPVHAAVVRGHALPDTDALDQCARILHDSGLVRYEVSNFARPGHECLHNTSYWQAHGYLGIGPSAVSTLYGGRSVRITQSRDHRSFLRLDSPLDAVDREYLDEEALLLEYLLLRLRTRDGIDRAAFTARFGFEMVERFSEEIERLVSRKLLVLDEESVRVPPDMLSFADAAVRGFL